MVVCMQRTCSTPLKNPTFATRRQPVMPRNQHTVEGEYVTVSNVHAAQPGVKLCGPGRASASVGHVPACFLVVPPLLLLFSAPHPQYWQHWAAVAM